MGDILLEFWEKYYNADMFKREKILEPILKNFREVIGIHKLDDKKFPKKYKDTTLRMFLMNYFDDLIWYMENRNRRKNKK